MKHTLILLFMMLTANIDAIEQTTLNNGNLILEDIPNIPNSIKQQLLPLQHIRKANLHGWGSQDQFLYMSTRFSQVDQLHRIQKPGGARQQLTFFPEPIIEAAPQPRGELIAFTKDQGGNESTSIYLLNSTTNKVQQTMANSGQNNELVWSPDGTKLAYRSTHRNGKSNDIWLLNIKDNKAISNKLLVKVSDGHYWMPMAFSSDSSKLLVLAYQSATQSAAYQVNTANKQLTPIAGSNMQAIYEPVGYGLDDNTIILLTDDDSQHIRLAQKNIRLDTNTVITANIPWTITSFAQSHNSKYAAFTANQHGYSQLYLLRLDDLSFQPIAQQYQGVIEKITFSKSGDKLAFSLENEQIAGDVFVYNLADKTTTRWSHSETGGLPATAFVKPQIIEYPTFDRHNDRQRKIPALYYKPSSTAPHPVIIFIHGGPEFQIKPEFHAGFQIWLQELGAAVIAPNIRGSRGYGKSYLALDNGFRREDAVKDIGALLDWVKTQPELDPTRVAVIGMSYGGYMSLASAVHYSAQLKAAVNIVGISNFVSFLQNTKAYRRDRRRAEYGDERIPEMRAFLSQISPLNHVDSIKVPMLVVQGQNDPRVPVTEATQLVKKLRDNGNKVWYMNALNEGHGYLKKENYDIYQQVVLLFFQQHLLDRNKQETQ